MGTEMGIGHLVVSSEVIRPNRGCSMGFPDSQVDSNLVGAGRVIPT